MGGSKLYLNKATIKNFRALVEIELPLGMFSVIIGDNDSGKTSAIHAIYWCLNGELPLPGSKTKRSINIDDIPKFSDDTNLEISVELEFIAENEPQNLSQDLFDQNKLVIRRFAKFEKDEDNNPKLKISGLEVRKRIPIGYENYEGMNAKEQKKYVIELARQVNFDIDNVNLLNNKDSRNKMIENIVEAYPDLLKWSFAPVQNHLKKKIQNILPEIVYVSSEEYKNPTDVVKRILQRSFKHTLENKDTENYGGKLKDLLKEDLQEEVERINESLKDIGFANSEISLEDIKIDFSNSLEDFNMKIKKHGSATKAPVNRMGTGTKRSLFLALSEAERRQITEESLNQVILCYDEPTMGLNYKTEKNLLNQLKEFSQSGKIQVLMITHSVTTINFVNLQNIIVFSLNKNGQSEIMSYSSNNGAVLATLGKHLGVENVAFLYYKIFVLVEGKADKLLFEKLLEKKFREKSSKIFVHDYKGSNFEIIVSFLKNLSNLSYVITCDNDKREKLEKLNVSNLFSFGEREIEDCFSNREIKKALSSIEPKTYISEDEIQKIREKCSKIGKGLSKGLGDFLHKEKKIKFDKVRFNEKLGETASLDTIHEDIQKFLEHIDRTI